MIDDCVSAIVVPIQPDAEERTDDSDSGLGVTALVGIAAGVLIILGAVAALFYIKKLKAARASAVVDKDLNKSAPPPPSVASVNSMGSMASMSSIFSVQSMASSVMDAPSRGKQAVMFNQGGPREQHNYI